MNAPSSGRSGTLLRMSCAMFMAYLTIGIPLSIVPLYVSQQLALNDIYVGLAVGCQFLTTLISRGPAGRWADKCGARKVTFAGFALCAFSGVAMMGCGLLPPHFIGSAYALLMISRILLGCGESLLLTGNLTWATGIVGHQQAGKVMSWNGMATYGALAAGAPLGLQLYHVFGLAVAGGITLLLPLAAWLLDVGLPKARLAPGQRLPMSRIISYIWRPGLGLMLQGIGFAVISTFTLLLFTEQHWDYAGFTLTAFGGAFILVRLLFGHLLDSGDGLRVARISLMVESVGLMMIAFAWHPAIALAGAALTGCGCSLIFPSLGVYLVRQVPAVARGTAIGGYSAFQDIAYGLTGPLAGALALYGGYRSLFIFAAVCALLGIVLLWRLLSSHNVSRVKAG